MQNLTLKGVTSNNPIEADDYGNLKVRTPLAGDVAGFTQLAYSPAAGVAKPCEVSENGPLSLSEGYPEWSVHWNGVAAVNAGYKVGVNATTMTRAAANGFLALNAASSAAGSVGISAYSTRVFTLQPDQQFRVRMYARTSNANAVQKQMDLGLGYYAFAAGQNAAMNEFIGFRWTMTGGLKGVVESSSLGAFGVQMIDINGNVPLTDWVARKYELMVSNNAVEFYVDGVYQGRITRPSESPGLLKGVSLPWIARVFNDATTVPTAAAQLHIGVVDVHRYSADYSSKPIAAAGQGLSSYYCQTDVRAVSTLPHFSPASGTVPTAATGSNSASVINNVACYGGYFRANAASITNVAHTNILIAAFQNPVIPLAVSAPSNNRSFFVTSIMVSRLTVTTAFTGGTGTNLSWGWFVAIGGTTTNMATSDADGTLAAAQRAPRLVPLALFQTLAIGAALGTQSADVGDYKYTFPTPLPVHPGEMLHIGIRSLQVGTAAPTAGTMDGNISINGYWE